jgi:hypothetical protein
MARSRYDQVEEYSSFVFSRLELTELYGKWVISKSCKI